MEGSGENGTPGGSGMSVDVAASGDWRSQLQPDARSRIINKILDTLQRHIPVYGPENNQQLRKIAMRFEDKIFTAASNQEDIIENAYNRIKDPEHRRCRSNGIKPLKLEYPKRVETLQEQLPVFRGQNLGDLRSIAVRFEEKMFASAKNQMDYLGKISLKMLTVEAKTRHIVFASKTASTLSDLSHSSPGGPGPDWQEEIYQKVRTMRDLYYLDLCEARWKIIQKCQQHESPAPPWLPSGRLESMKKMMHQEDRLVELLRLPRSSIRPHLQEESPHYEKQILHFNDSEGRTIAGGGVNSLPNMSVDFRPGNGAPVNQRGTSR